jgi:hypothetical protein
MDQDRSLCAEALTNNDDEYSLKVHGSSERHGMLPPILALPCILVASLIYPKARIRKVIKCRKSVTLKS